MLGRPPKYDSKYCKLAYREFRKGYSKTAVAGALGITRDTFYRWCGEHPEFYYTVRRGECVAFLYWSRILRESALGTTKYKVNSKALIYILQTRFPKTYGKDAENLEDKVIIEIEEREAKKVKKKSHEQIIKEILERFEAYDKSKLKNKTKHLDLN